MPDHKDPTVLQAKELPDQLNFPQLEEDIQKYWDQIDAFRESLRRSEGKKTFTFYDGPPFATGTPHYGHILAGTIKDVVCRYAHQTGHHVERRFGWDCHGLPIEFEIEKLLGIKSSHDVKEMGIAKYNAECRKIVMRFAKEWEIAVSRMGRWIDFENDYKTMNLSYMESVWWVFKQLHEKKLVYRGFKVMPFSTACTTPLSNFESNMNYKDVSDPSVIVTFPVVGDENSMFCAWTTTPWTLPSNLCLCVNPEMDYVKVLDKKSERHYILAECRLEEIYKNYKKQKESSEWPFKVEKKMKGAELKGTRYVPLFDFFAQKADDGAFRVQTDGYVTSDSGTGVVHCAPGFGEEDFRVCRVNGVIQKGEVVCPVDENGCFTKEVTDWAGKYIKDCDNSILEAIKGNGRLVSKAAIVHSYPFCWRSETPLIYKAVASWFVGVESIRTDLMESCAQTKWVPDFVKTKRFANWLENAQDWAVSRNRYWGTPLPIWHSADWEEIVVVGSVAELEKLTGKSNITDLHREFVDDLTIPSKRPGMPPLKRVPEVFDCWFESGSMPYAECHYPFENKEHFEKHRFPGDFIAEGLDQTRGWFYTMLVLSTALFGKSSYKNVVVNGLVLASDGKKMSKRLKNYPDVMEVVNKHSADALRLYLINSPVVRAEPLRFKEEGVKDVVKDVFLPLFNATKFFLSNANRFLRNGGTIDINTVSTNDMDRWIVAAANSFIKYVHREMDEFRLYTVVPGVLRFLDTLTNWYVRMNRRRLKGTDIDAKDWGQSLSTLFNVLFAVCRAMAPFTPFMAEVIYQHLKPIVPEAQREDSVHFMMIPEVDTSRFCENLERSMERMISVIDLVRVVRDRVGIALRTPVREVVVIHPDSAYLNDVRGLEGYIKTEVNCFDLKFTSEEGDFVLTTLDGDLKALGKKYKKEAAGIAKALKALEPAKVKEFLSTKKITVAGKDLEEEDVRVIRSFREGITQFETNTDGKVLVLMDKTQDDSVIEAALAREFVSRIQQLRKKAGLVVEDKVDVFYETTDEKVLRALKNRADLVNATVKSLWRPLSEKKADAKVMAEEDGSIGDGKMKLVFTPPTK